MLPEWLRGYIDDYFVSDDFHQWDEIRVFNKAASDNSLSDEDRIILAKTLSIGYLSRTEFIHDYAETRAKTEKDCYKRYNRICFRATVLLVITGGISAALGQPEGIILAGAAALSATEDAQYALEDCLESLSN